LDLPSRAQIESCRLIVCGVEQMGIFFERLGKRFRNIIEFLKDTRKELKNVSWPSRRETMGTTIVVIVAVFFFGFFLFLVDFVLNNGMNYIRALAAR
jgi:preprotein translocase SecE subunit